MASALSARVPAWAVLAAAIGCALAVAAAAVALRPPAAVPGSAAPEAAAGRPPIVVPLWVDPNAVRHRTRFLFSFDPPEALAALRAEERLDRVVAAAAGDLDRFRRLTAWARARFEPGVPSPYPPIDARVILRDVRAGRTGGFCAQYNYVLVQALLSLGHLARYVTVVDHEVVEAWARDERRWICLDPLHAATYVDEAGRALSVLELNGRTRRGEPLLAGPGSLPGAAGDVGRAFARFEVWLRNDHVVRPLNFADLPRYKVRFLEEGEAAPAGDGLWTREAADLYFDPEAL
jgi:hypothetical protein